MERLKFNIHFSFWLIFAAALFFRQSFLFAMYAAAMVLHETAHYLAARKLFYRCTKMQLSAFGAVLYGDFHDVYGADRIKIAVAGPLANIAVCIVLPALWWLLPESYVFTEAFFTANAGMAAVNMLPCYPLDGGRVATGLAEKKFDADRSLSLVKNATIVISVLLFICFAVSLFCSVKLFSLGLFSVFLFTGVFTKSGGEYYVRKSYCENYRGRLKKGMEKKTLVFSAESNFGKVVKRMQGGHLYCLEVVNDRMTVTAQYSAAQLDKLVLCCPPDVKLTELKKYL